MRLRAAAIALFVFAACGGQGGQLARTPDDAGPDGGASASDAGNDAGSDAGTDGGADGGVTTAASLAGLWDVAGSDARGDYAGAIQIAADGTFQRTVAWKTTTVEDGRTLHHAFAGTVRQAGDAVALQASLDPRGFVTARGGLLRSLGDAPVVLDATAALAGQEVRAAWTTPQRAGETWTNRRPAGAPLYTSDRRELPAHDPPSNDARTAAFAAFASYQSLPAVQPYAARADFQAAVHQVVLDRTDFAFYRADPNALRVVDKAVDAISLLEARLRADAFRHLLAEKARLFDRELQADFIDPVAPMVPDGRAGDMLYPSGDAALWNATYIASQWYRHQVTGEAEALDNLVRSLEPQLVLQEITGDWTAFARAVRRATGAAGNGWHAGGPSYPQLEWLEGGNNDMFKGLFYALTAGFFALCDGRDHALCPRIRTNIKHLADDVHIGTGFNDLMSAWLASIALDSSLERAKYRAKAESRWAAQKVVEKNNALQYADGIADWSGTHLAFVGAVTALFLADRADLGGDARDVFRGQIARSWEAVQRQRLVLWDLASARPEAVEDAVWILREMPFPKQRARIDHRINPAFSMSPFPSLPWKNDWTVNDRTQALRILPLFELPANNYQWKTHMDFSGDTENYRNHGVDYLHAYWYGRRAGLFSGAE